MYIEVTNVTLAPVWFNKNYSIVKHENVYM